MPRFMVNRNGVGGWSHGDVVDVDEREFAAAIANGDLSPYPEDVELPFSDEPESDEPAPAE